MSVKTTLVVGASVIVLAAGATQALEPRTVRELQEQRSQQQVRDASNSLEKINETTRARADADAEANRLDKFNPSESRRGRLPKIRLRWLP
jgi:hypothetical protein